MNARVLTTLAVAACLVFFGGGATAQEKDKGKGKDGPAKAPVGTWKKADDNITVVITVTDKMAVVTIKSDNLNLDFEADYALSRGKTVFACIRKMKEGDEKLVGELLGFEYEAGETELELSKFKGSGAVGFGALFMNGKYKKEPAKKD